MSKQVSNFVKTMLARVTGDKDQLLALKNEKLATSALKTQIALKDGELVEATSNLEDAMDALEEATFPSEAIERSNYVSSLLNAQNAVTDAEDNVNDIKDTLKFLNETLKSFA